MSPTRATPPSFAIAAVLALAVPAVAEEPAGEAPPFEARVIELERRIADLAAVDPHQPEALEARVEYARLLQEEAKADCAPHLDEAERQLMPILGAGREKLLAWPDGPGDTLSLLQSIQNTRGLCAPDEATSRAAFESAVATGRRAVDALRDNWDYEEMAIAQFNVAFARRELGDLDGALDSLDQVIAWDLEYGLHEDLQGDYAARLRWASGEEADATAVRRFVDSYARARARFRFDWKPHRSRHSTEMLRSALRHGALQEVRSRIESETRASREGDDWVLSSAALGKPRLEASGLPASTPGTDAIEAMMSGMASALPEMVVAADGSFKELRGLERFREALGNELDRALAAARPAGAPAPDPKALAAAKAAVLNPDQLTAKVAGEWNLLVAAWVDGELDHGDWYEASFEEPLPGFSDRPVQMTWTFKVARWLPCQAGGERQCVELLLRIRPDEAQIREVLADFVGRLMPDADQARVAQAMREVSFRMEMRYRLVTEPDTLRPWSFEERRYVYGASLENGKREVNARFDRTLETIHYED